MTTLGQLIDAIEIARGWGVGLDEPIGLVSDPDGQFMEPGTYGIAAIEASTGLLTAGIVGNLEPPKEI